MDKVSVIHILYAESEYLIVLWHFVDVVIGLMLNEGKVRDVLNHNGKIILTILLCVKVCVLTMLCASIVYQKKHGSNEVSNIDK